MDYRLSMFLIVVGIFVCIGIMMSYVIYYLLKTPDIPE